MRAHITLVAVLTAACSLVWASDKARLETHKKITGVYRIYGGGLGDPVAPTKKDAKLMLSVDGKMANDLFDAIGPDIRDACTDGSGARVRARDNQNLLCMRTPGGEYSCNFGFDLRTGKSIGGIVC